MLQKRFFAFFFGQLRVSRLPHSGINCGTRSKSLLATTVRTLTSETMPKTKAGGDEEKSSRFQLSNTRFVTVNEFKGKVRVDIREYYMTDDGEKKPGKKGISLSLDEFKKLTAQLGDIEKKIKEISGELSSSSSSEGE